MKKHPYQFFARKTLKTITIVVASMTAAFILGIETAGDVQPIVSSTKAGGSVLEGDVDDNGTIDLRDAQIALEIARGNRVASPRELEADPNQDFHITLEDVATILEHIRIHTTN